MAKLWSKEFWQRNQDYKGIVNSTQWTASAEGEKQYLSFTNEEDYTERVEVTGDLLGAKNKLPETNDNWPSTWLGPQGEGDWDELLEELGLERAGEPVVD